MADESKSSDNNKEDKTSKCDCFFRYETVFKLDLFLLLLHLLAIFVIYNVYMFTTIILVRVPRLAMGGCQMLLRRDSKK